MCLANCAAQHIFVSNCIETNNVDSKTFRCRLMLADKKDTYCNSEIHAIDLHICFHKFLMVPILLRNVKIDACSKKISSFIFRSEK